MYRPTEDVRRGRRPLGMGDVGIGDDADDNCANLLFHAAPIDDEEKRLVARARRGEVGITAQFVRQGYDGSCGDWNLVFIHPDTGLLSRVQIWLRLGHERLALLM